MTTLLFIQVVGLIVVGYISVHGIVNRICKCAETCAALKAFGPKVIEDPELFKEALGKVSAKK